MKEIRSIFVFWCTWVMFFSGSLGETLGILGHLGMGPPWWLRPKVSRWPHVSCVRLRRRNSTNRRVWVSWIWGEIFPKTCFFWGGFEVQRQTWTGGCLITTPRNLRPLEVYMCIYIYKVMASTTEWTTMSSIMLGMHDDAMSFPWPLPNLCQAPIDHKIKVGSEFGLNFSPCPPENSDFCSSK